MKLIQDFFLGVLIFLVCMCLFYLFFTKIMSFSRIMWNDKQKKDYPEELFIIEKKFFFGIILSGLALMVFIQFIFKMSYDFVLYFSLTWGFFWFWLNIWMNKIKNNRQKKTNKKPFSKEMWTTNLINKVPLLPFELEDFSNLDGIRRKIGDGIYFYRDQCNDNSLECNVYRIEVENSNIVVLKLRCALENIYDGLIINYQLLYYKTKLVWIHFLFAIPMILIFLFITPVAILLPLIGIVVIFFLYKKHKYDLVQETIDYFETRIFVD